MTRHTRALTLICAVASLVLPVRPAAAQTERLEYRVVHAAPYELQRLVDDAGRDGFTCVSVARPETDVRLASVAVILARPYFETTHVPARVTHRVLRTSGSGGELGGLLDRGAAEGYRLCGLALAEVSPAPVLVAVMNPDAEHAAGSRHYAAAVLGNAERVARLAGLGRDGFAPIAATPINDNRVPEQRSWLVVAEQTGTQPVDIVVRSRPGPDALRKAILEQGEQGFVSRLLWKEGLTAIVVVMSRAQVDASRRPEFDLDAIDPLRLDGRSGAYVGDVQYLSDGQRLVLTTRERSSTTYVVTSPLPRLGPRDYASAADLVPLAEQLGRTRSRDRARIVASSVRRGSNGELFLHAVLTQPAR